MGKTPVKKLIVVLCILAAAGFSIFLYQFLQYVSGAPGGNSPEGVAAAFIEAAYQGDYGGVYALLPKTFQNRALEDTKNTWEIEADEDAMRSLGSSLMEYIQTLNGSMGEGWSMDYEIQSTEFYNPEELEETNQLLRMMGTEYKANKAARVTVQVSFLALNGTEGSATIVVPVYRSGVTWDLGQYIGSGVPDPNGIYFTWFGDLMDGFNIEGVFDADGNQLYDADGNAVQQEN